MSSTYIKHKTIFLFMLLSLLLHFLSILPHNCIKENKNCRHLLQFIINHNVYALDEYLPSIVDTIILSP